MPDINDHIDPDDDYTYHGPLLHGANNAAVRIYARRLESVPVLEIDGLASGVANRRNIEVVKTWLKGFGGSELFDKNGNPLEDTKEKPRG